METLVVGETAKEFPVHFDKYAYGADHVVVCNRIRPRTQFARDLESISMRTMWNQYYSIAASYLFCAAVAFAGLIAQVGVSIWARRVEPVRWR